MTNWPPSLPPSRPENGHSTKELEHRFTSLEVHAEQSEEDHSDLRRVVSKHGEKLTLHERVLLGLLIAFATLAQERMPYVAAFLKALTGS